MILKKEHKIKSKLFPVPFGDIVNKALPALLNVNDISICLHKTKVHKRKEAEKKEKH